MRILALEKFPAIVLSLASAILLSIPWWTVHWAGSLCLFVGFVPLLVLQQKLHDQGRKGFLWWVALSIALFILGEMWWASLAFWGAIPAAVGAGTLSLWPAWAAYHWVWKRGRKALAYTILVSWWVALEAWYATGDVSFPWQTLGNAFGWVPEWIQWFTATGQYGGSVWVVVANILIFTALSKRKVWWVAAAWVVLPIGASYVQYARYQEPTPTIEVAAIQPNIDPYTEKFSSDGLAVVLELAKKEAPATTQLYVAPETTIYEAIDADYIGRHPDVVRVQQFLRTHNPSAAFIVGASVWQRGKMHNSSLWIDTIGVQCYHKGKLVIGVEVVPSFLVWIAQSVDLGGYVGGLGKSQERKVFGNNTLKVGAPICYESIFGGYYAEWAARGAELMCIITNDGWWGDTEGHRHHAAYARSRAVETRRAIVRSANTGISCLITPRGDVVKELGWDKKGVVVGKVALNKALTPYVVWGDWVVRLSILVGALSVLYFVGLVYRKR